LAGSLVFEIFAQGTIFLNNRTPTGDVRIYSIDGLTGIGSAANGATAQLFLVSSNGGALVPLYPSTAFRTNSAAVAFFVAPVEVSVPGYPAGSQVRIILRAWENGFDYPGFRWESVEPLTVTLGGTTTEGETLPPATLSGLQGGRPLTPAYVYLEEVSREDDRWRFYFLNTYWIPFYELHVEASTDLNVWQPVGVTWETKEMRRSFTVPAPGVGNGNLFYRIRGDVPKPTP
jgi:hypothetical protein